MNRTCIHSLLFLPFLGGLLCSALSTANAQNEIVQNPEAVLLRNVWMVQGSPGDRVGEGVGSVGDINGDSIGDFAWYEGKSYEWRVHLGGSPISQTAVDTFYLHSSIPPHPIVGNFWGNGQRGIMFAKYRREDTGRQRFFMEFPLYKIEGDTITKEAWGILDPSATTWEGISGTPDDYFAIDLDRDGDDEVVIVQNVVRRNDDVRDARAEVWIYEGGPDFQLDTPSVVLKDTEENFSRFNGVTGDFNGDSYPDLLLNGNYVGSGPGNRPNKLKFWWGKEYLSELPTNADRTIELVDPLYPRIGDGFTVLDCDGDKVSDLWFPGPDGYYYLYRMGIDGKDPVSRPLTLEDADGKYKMNAFDGFNMNLGYMNDSLRRFEMVGVIGSDGNGGDRLVGLSGGRYGPNETYDAVYTAALDGIRAGDVLGRGGIVENCTGRGWDCFVTGNPMWGGQEQGIVILLEGGSYIPTDDTTSGVETIATRDHAEAFHTWPNPVIDELHIAWRGDLKSPPSLMVVYDIQGREITSGAVEAWRGEAVWRCGDVSAGTYLLAIYDRTGELLATTRVVRRSV